MEERKITPAINLQNEFQNELSAEDFQKNLYSWFEDRGILSNLRAHLRKQMVGALKDTAIGKTVRAQKPTISPKLQALNLLIAEFLLNQDYHYTLSVFTTEVPLVNIFPELSTFALVTPRKRWQFNEKDVWDILETLGIPRNSEEGRNIGETYLKITNKESLLTCIMRLNAYKDSVRMREVISANVNEKSLKSLIDLLLINNVDPQCVEKVAKLMEETLEAEQKRVQEAAREDYVRLQANLEQEAAKFQEEQREKLTEMQNSFELEKNAIVTQRSRHQVELNEFREQVAKHHKALQDRYQFVLKREAEVEKRAKEVEESEINVRKRELQVTLHQKQLDEEQKKFANLRKLLQKEIENKKSMDKYELIHELQHSIQTAREEFGNCSRDQDPCEPEKMNEENLVQVIKRLENENTNLRTVNKKQHIKIHKLVFNAKMPPFKDCFAIPDSPKVIYTGAGEEISRRTTAHESRRSRNDLPLPTSNYSSSSSDEYTNNILQDARQRLARLEEETKKVDRYYRKFKAQNDPRSLFADLYGSSKEEHFSTSRRLSAEVTKNESLGQIKISKSLKNENKANLCKLGSSVTLSRSSRTELSSQEDDLEKSVASSGIVELLAAGASGVSMSEFDITDDPEDEQSH